MDKGAKAVAVTRRNQVERAREIFSRLKRKASQTSVALWSAWEGRLSLIAARNLQIREIEIPRQRLNLAQPNSLIFHERRETVWARLSVVEAIFSSHLPRTFTL